MNHKLCACVFLLMSVLVGGLILSPPVAAAFKYIQDGMEAPVVTGKDLLTGEEVSSKARSEDEVILVAFWATWSKRSMEQLEDMKEMTSTYEGHPFRVIAVNVEGERFPSETVNSIKETVQSMELPFPVILDEGLEIFYSYGVIAVPSTALLNSEGILRYGPAGYSYTVRDRMVDSTEVLLGIREAKEVPGLAKGYEPDPTSSRYYRLGVQLAGEGMLERAAENASRAAEADPKFSGPHRLRGEILLKLEKPQEAVTAFEQAVALDSASVSAWAGWGRALVWSGDTSGGREKLEHALSMDENYTPALLDLALCRCQEGEVDLALEMLLAARDLNPLDWSIHYNLGKCYRLTGNTAEAVKSFEEALQFIYPDSR